MKRRTHRDALLFGIIAALIIGAIVFLESQKADIVSSGENSRSQFSSAPELQGISAWINSEPLTIESLKGKVVLVDFWTYTCINCIRTQPYLNSWHAKYANKGLVIIGVHTPEFEFEKKLENVQKAVKDEKILYPVALDNNYATWNAFRNQYWPRKYLIDKDGRIRYDHIGEGAYEETEKKIQELLAETGMDASAELTKENQTNFRPITPELYAGYAKARAPLGNAEGYQPEEVVTYTLPSEIPQNYIVLEGQWKNNPESLEMIGDSGKLVLAFTARTINIVAESTPAETAQVFIDGKETTAAIAGKDVAFTNGHATILFDEPKLYALTGPGNQYGLHLLVLDVKKGFSFNAFTFGS